MISSVEISKLKKTYTPGTPVELISMDDPYRIDLVRGTLGRVNSTAVDDAGQIHVSWIGNVGGEVRVISSLAAVPGYDELRIISAKELWQEFGDVPMDPESECIENEWRCFTAGTNREEIWHWFESFFDISVGELMENAL